MGGERKKSESERAGERGRWNKERWTQRITMEQGREEEEEEGGQAGREEVWHASRIIPPASSSSSLSFWMRWAGRLRNGGAFTIKRV